MSINKSLKSFVAGEIGVVSENAMQMQIPTTEP